MSVTKTQACAFCGTTNAQGAESVGVKLTSAQHFALREK
jgi:hypothetical protein